MAKRQLHRERELNRQYKGVRFHLFCCCERDVGRSVTTSLRQLHPRETWQLDQSIEGQLTVNGPMWTLCAASRFEQILGQTSP